MQNAVLSLRKDDPVLRNEKAYPICANTTHEGNKKVRISKARTLQHSTTQDTLLPKSQAPEAAWDRPQRTCESLGHVDKDEHFTAGAYACRAPSQGWQGSGA